MSAPDRGACCSRCWPSCRTRLASARTRARRPWTSRAPTRGGSASRDRAQWLAADALEAIGGPFDILISNPPYIPTSEIAGLDPEVRCYDPPPALDGGEDGLRFFHRLVARMAQVVPDGWVGARGGARSGRCGCRAAGFDGSAASPGHQVLSRCRRKATVCGRQNTELSICPESPWILAAVRDRLGSVESSMHHAVAAACWAAMSGCVDRCEAWIARNKATYRQHH